MCGLLKHLVLLVLVPLAALASSQGEYFFHYVGEIEYEGYVIRNDGDRWIRVWYGERYAFSSGQVGYETRYVELAPGGSWEFATVERHYCSARCGINIIDRDYHREEEFGPSPHTHAWSSYDNVGGWQTGTWSAWTPAWDSNAHYTDESQTQTRSRTDQRWHNRGRSCTCGADEDVGTDFWETTTVSDSQTVWGNRTRPHVHAWVGYDQAGGWQTGSWSAWSPAWNPADHYSDESQSQTRSRTDQRWHDRGRQCSGCGADEDLGTDSWEYSAQSDSRTLWGTQSRDANQSEVSLEPGFSSINTGDSVTFNASGGDGTGAYTWGGAASGTGSSKTITFAAPGTYYVAVYRAESAGWNTSDSVTAYVDVNDRVQAPVSVTPMNPTIVVGQSLILTANGGGGSGSFRWGNSASGIGVSKAVSFAAPGTYFVTVVRDASAGWLASNTATATITVTLPFPVTLQVRARAVPRAGMQTWVAPSQERIWTATVQPVSP